MAVGPAPTMLQKQYEEQLYMRLAEKA